MVGRSLRLIVTLQWNESYEIIETYQGLTMFGTSLGSYICRISTYACLVLVVVVFVVNVAIYCLISTRGPDLGARISRDILK